MFKCKYLDSTWKYRLNQNLIQFLYVLVLQLRNLTYEFTEYGNANINSCQTGRAMKGNMTCLQLQNVNPSISISMWRYADIAFVLTNVLVLCINACEIFYLT